MDTTLNCKPLAIRDAAAYAEDIMSALTTSDGPYFTDQALILDTTAHGLIQQDDPDLVQFGYFMSMEAVLVTPAEVLGQILHAKARELHAHLAEGMPRISA